MSQDSTEGPSLSSPSWTIGHYLLLGMLLILSFFLGSTRVTQADFWMQLATGRLLSQGGYTFGVDPFSWATTGTYWANHSWGYAFVLYPLYQALSSGIVVVNGLLAMGLFCILLKIRPANLNPLIGLEFAGLTMVVASGRMGVGSYMVSLLFQAMLMYLLVRGGVLGSQPKPSSRALWCIPFLFVLWPNVDVHFMDGVMVLLFCMIGWVWARFSEKTAHDNTLPLIVALSLAACCLNPHHVHVFTFPPEFAFMVTKLGGGGLPTSWVGAGLVMQELAKEDSSLFLSLASPLSSLYYGQEVAGLNVAGLAYYLLLMAHLVSMVLVLLLPKKPGIDVSLPRFFVGFLFTIFSLLQARMIPSFAMVVGPLTLLNWSDVIALRKGTAIQPTGGLRASLENLLAGILLLVTLFLAWPGWLHSGFWKPDAPRRVGWRVVENASLRKMAERLAKEPDARVFNLDREIASYAAYFAPGVKTGLDHRFALFAPEVENIKAVENYFRDPRPAASKAPSWRTFFQSHDLRYLALTNYVQKSALYQKVFLENPYMRQWRDYDSWSQVYADGRSILFSYHSKGEAHGEKVLEEWNRRAFGPDSPKKRIPTVASPSSFAEEYLRGTPLTAPLTADAAMWAPLYMALKENWREPWESANVVAGWVPALLVGQSYPCLFPTISLPTLSNIASGRRVASGNQFDIASLPILMVRDSHLGVRQLGAGYPLGTGPNPFKSLSTGYWLLNRDLEDSWTNAGLPHGPSQRLRLFRNIQIAAAARKAILFNSMDYEMNELLANLMREYSYLDFELEFQRRMLQTRQETVAMLKGAATVEFKNQSKEMENRQRELLNLYQHVKKTYDERVKKLGDSPEEQMQQFDLALRVPVRQQHPQTKQIFDLRVKLADAALLAAGKSPLSVEKNLRVRIFQLRLRLQFYLELGLTDQAVALLNENGGDAEHFMQDPNIAFMIMALEASRGDNERADLILQRMEPAFSQDRLRQLVAENLLGIFGSASASGIAGGGLTQSWAALMGLEGTYLVALNGNLRSEQRVYRGLLALEEGENARAILFFQEALDQEWKGSFFPERNLAQHYLDLLQGQEKKNR